ncbi:lysophospholipid acyltransferase family protein [Arcobacter sp. CECT 8985]|uniref:lysophospholipid acyltransferase family protein n=1 Tax=Arcobacter sp. CECT 8985 TaxID=1935424 RepID=UPI0013E9955A|nr:lysophospholipid acyltransferase family protein [Arcobacter sp. CECT 8985]
MLISGVSIKNRHFIPQDKQFIIIANHNSHIDIFAILSIFKINQISKIKPVAASDYFFKTKILKWISINLIDILPISRRVKKIGKSHPLDNIYAAIEDGYSLIIFPEGSRGEPQVLQKFKNGIGHIASRYPNIPIVPIILEDTGKALPRNEALFVPFIIKLEIKKSFTFNDSNLEIKEFVKKLENIFKQER